MLSLKPICEHICSGGLFNNEHNKSYDPDLLAPFVLTERPPAAESVHCALSWIHYSYLIISNATNVYFPQIETAVRVVVLQQVFLPIAHSPLVLAPRLI